MAFEYDYYATRVFALFSLKHYQRPNNPLDVNTKIWVFPPHVLSLNRCHDDSRSAKFGRLLGLWITLGLKNNLFLFFRINKRVIGPRVVDK